MGHYRSEMMTDKERRAYLRGQEASRLILDVELSKLTVRDLVNILHEQKHSSSYGGTIQILEQLGLWDESLFDEG